MLEWSDVGKKEESSTDFMKNIYIYKIQDSFHTWLLKQSY